MDVHTVTQVRQDKRGTVLLGQFIGYRTWVWSENRYQKRPSMKEYEGQIIVRRQPCLCLAKNFGVEITFAFLVFGGQIQ